MEAYEITLRSVCLYAPPPHQICPATTVSSAFNVPAFGCHIASYSKVVERGVLFAVRVVSHTQSAVEGKLAVFAGYRLLI
jgi:hypothetical protein